MRRACSFCLLVVGLTLPPLSVARQAREGAQDGPPPNVLLISLDALRRDRLGCYGHTRQTSPFLDELAARGVRFRNAFVNSNSTESSHTTMLSSQYTETHRVSMFESPETRETIRTISEKIPMAQELLRRHGYATIGVTSGGWLNAEIGFDRGFDDFDSSIENVEQGTRRLLELIRGQSGSGKPIFAFFHTYEIHSPYEPPPRYREMFGHFESEIRPTNEVLTEVCPEAATKLKDADWRFLEAMYDGEIRYTDDTLRELFSALTAEGFLDRSLVIITADHGEEFGEHGGCLHGEQLYDELLHVPLILSGSIPPRGEIPDRLVSSVDILPTILAAAGVEQDLPLAGRDLLARAGRARGEAVYAQMGPWVYAVRTRDWKLIEWKLPTPSLELYDLRADPGEQNDLSAKLPRRVRSLQKKLASWRNRQVAVAGPETTLSKEQIEKLKALGYLQ